MCKPTAWSFSGLVGETENSSKRVDALGAQGREPLTPQQMLCTPLAGSRDPQLGGVWGGETPTRPLCSPCSLFGSPQEERVQDADSVRRQQQAHQQHSCTLDECFQFYTKEEQVPPWGSAPWLDGGVPGPISGWAHGPGGFPSSWPRTTRGGAPTARPCSRGW